ncbi:hypothetical protein BpHYR1_032457 [Brachionus plicatilis]|uniref:Uncharacterized protein n=1 Tax=Brachionus plicatilis TaxID=10195 RepID=A0A3M7SUN5_BRAPC|nr:hypothetical protein BpHYR1_032457 [Brachionus plicatilis]
MLFYHMIRQTQDHSHVLFETRSATREMHAYFTFQHLRIEDGSVFNRLFVIECLTQHFPRCWIEFRMLVGGTNFICSHLINYSTQHNSTTQLNIICMSEQNPLNIFIYFSNYPKKKYKN